MLERLRQFLTERKMTQRELASQMDLREEYLSRILAGKTPLTDAFIGRFAAAFGFDTAKAVFAEPEPQP